MFCLLLKYFQLRIPQGGLCKTETFEQMMEEQNKYHPLGRVGTVEEVAGMVAFLASDEAKFMTGQTIGIDGGRALSQV